MLFTQEQIPFPFNVLLRHSCNNRSEIKKKHLKIYKYSCYSVKIPYTNAHFREEEQSRNKLRAKVATIPTHLS